ncbi:hypothetical protein [Aquimonas voraii]|uniref:Uncharacterized protein n=1 Tax=Aquimonas voraii TaxID=265719 RepID=A0A1G6WW68_9GAMM|nr:hypothetical protein [Aquimonas voraii]SDD70081.1 hypothetical protein SAMN04488509_105197 [Aquimonas voraii]
MNLKRSIALTVLAGSAASFMLFSPAHAASLDQAQVGCYVDTYAFDTLTADYCVSAWTPSSAQLRSVAYFEVIGLPAGNYSYSWNFACGNSRSCSTSITARPEQIKTAVVTVTNVATGEQRTLSATAEYLNGWD